MWQGVIIITSNARVTPLCLISISHLELMGAVIGKKLALSITDTLNIDKELGLIACFIVAKRM